MRTKCDTGYLDVMDGKAVPNFCWGNVEKLNRFRSELGLRLHFEVHLMVENPLEQALKWLEYDWVTRVIVRSEEVYDLDDFQLLAKDNVKLGLAIDPETDETPLLGLENPNHLLVMGVASGFSGKSLVPSALRRIRSFKRRWPWITIGVDGGMNL